MEELHESKTVNLLKNEGISDTISELYKDALDNSSFTCDLIIKAEGVEHYCHRIILASASEFLRHALSTATPGTMPVIILPDIALKIWKYILVYVYNGEVQVPLNMYAEFEEACSLLELKGLNDGDGVGGIEQYQFMNSGTYQEDLGVKQEHPDVVDETENMAADVINTDDDKLMSIKQELDTWSDDNMDSDIEVDVDDDKDVSWNEEESDESDYIPNIKVIKRNTKREMKSHMLKVTNINEVVQEGRVKDIVRGIYGRLNKKLGSKLETAVNSTKLLIEDGVLFGAEHFCGFCGQEIFIHYRRQKFINSIAWKNCNLRHHFTKIHNFKYAPLLRGRRNEKNMVEVTTKTQVDFEKRAIDTIRRTYESLNLLPNIDLEEAINTTKLDVQNNQLNGAHHFCGFCGKLLILSYKKMSSPCKIKWRNESLKRHLSGQHKTL